jgi:hypothetical protein
MTTSGGSYQANDLCFVGVDAAAGGQHDVPWYPHNRFVIRLVIAGHSVSSTVCREGGHEEIS